MREDIPILASPLTLAILKGMKDSGRLTGGLEAICHSRRKAGENLRVLRAINKEPYYVRNLISTEAVSEQLRSFLSTKPGQNSPRSRKLQPGSIFNIGSVDLPFDIKSFDVDHSIYGATAYILTFYMGTR